MNANKYDIIQKIEKLVIKRKSSGIYILVMCVFIIVMLVVFITMKKNNLQISIPDSSTLPGSTEINPAVMYNGNIYYWDRMAGPTNKLPQGVLPDGYEYVGDISYITNENLTQDLQFIAKFKATGQLYYNISNPDCVYIRISTHWLENAYVKFVMESEFID